MTANSSKQQQTIQEGCDFLRLCSCVGRCKEQRLRLTHPDTLAPAQIQHVKFMNYAHTHTHALFVML